MKKLVMGLILMLATSLAFVNCEKDDDETITFLEKYDGTVWKNQGDFDWKSQEGTKWQGEVEEEDTQYLRFIDNINTPFESWNLFSNSECYYYNLFDLYEPEDKITKNNENTFGIRHTEVDEGIETIIDVVYTINGNTLTVTMEQTGDGSTISISFDYTKSTEDVDSFVLCN